MCHFQILVTFHFFVVILLQGGSFILASNTLATMEIALILDTFYLQGLEYMHFLCSLIISWSLNYLTTEKLDVGLDSEI